MDQARKDEEVGELTQEQIEAKKKWFQLGHLESQLERAGEPDATIENITNCTYKITDDVLQRDHTVTDGK